MVNVTDFLNFGKFELSSGVYDQNRIADYIGRYERQYLIELFGAELYNDYIAQLDLSGVSTEQRFIELEQPFAMDISAFNVIGTAGNNVGRDARRIIISNGLDDMLRGFIYFEYLKDSISTTTPVGVVQPYGENSKTPNTLHIQIYTRYNESVRTYRAIQDRIIANPNDFDYSKSNGVSKMLTSWL